MLGRRLCGAAAARARLSAATARCVAPTAGRPAGFDPRAAMDPVGGGGLVWEGHLAASSPEFASLADVEARVGGVAFPLHSQVLASASGMFAQMFATLGVDASPARRTDVSNLFEGEGLATVVLATFLLYNPEHVGRALAGGWPRRLAEQAGSKAGAAVLGAARDAGARALLPPAAAEVAPPLLHAVLRLADKLAAGKLLGALSAGLAAAPGRTLRRGLLGWLATAERLNMHDLRARALRELGAVLSCQRPPLAAPPHPYPGPAAMAAAAAAAAASPLAAAAELLRDPDFRGLSRRTLLIVVDLLVAQRAGRGRELPLARIAAAAGGGELSAALAEQVAAAPGPGFLPPPLHPGDWNAAMQAANEEQAELDWNAGFGGPPAEWEEEGDEEEEEEEEAAAAAMLDAAVAAELDAAVAAAAEVEAAAAGEAGAGAAAEDDDEDDDGGAGEEVVAANALAFL